MAGITPIGLAARIVSSLASPAVAARQELQQRPMRISEPRPATPRRLSRWCVEKSHQRSTIGTEERRVMPAKALADRAGGEPGIGAAVGLR